MNRLLFLAAPLALLAAGPAAACLYTQVPEAVGDSSAQFLARRMVAAATHVDLVLVEDDGTRPMGEAQTGVLTLRSIARLKGNGPDRFSLFGAGLTLRPEAEQVFQSPLQHFTREDGRVTPFPYNEERQGRLFPDAAGAPPPPPVMTTSCSPPVIGGQSGRFYVVMRGADGRLLGDFPLYDGARAPAFAFVPVTLGRDDYWLRAVQLAMGEGPAPEGAAVLHLRGDSDPARVEAALRRVGVTAVAAFVGSGDWLDEVRPAADEARSLWLVRAVPLVAQRDRGGLGLADHGGAEFLRSRLGFEQTFGGLGYEVAQAFTASVRRKQAARGARPRLVAVALAGPANVIAGLTREPFAAWIRPLPARPHGLAALPGGTEAERFATIQAIERDIWLLNGGNGNPQGSLPAR
ncbi:MAG TPA: hypothetical protein VGA98_07960 [Allosphingosinicella sp.]|jgi:hypothetical protein